MDSTCLRILLAEDDPTLAHELEACLRDAGHEVLAVEARSESALTATRLLQPDLVLLNTHLRGALDAPAVAARLRAHAPRPIPVVLLAVTAGPLLAQQLHAVVASVVVL